MLYAAGTSFLRACAAVTNVALNLLWIGTLGLHGIVLASLVAWALLAGIYQWTLRAECTQTSYGLTQPFLLCVGCMTVVSVSSMSLGNKTVPMAVLLLCVIALGPTPVAPKNLARPTVRLPGSPHKKMIFL